MTFPAQDYEDYAARILADIQTNLPGANAWLRRSVENVLGKALAGAVHGTHGHLAWVARQLLPTEDADDETILFWADVHGLTRKPATFSGGSIDITLNSATVPAGTAFERSDGTRYTTDSAITSTAVSDETLQVNVTAEETGPDGDSEVGTALTLVSPIANVQSTASVGSAGLIGGADRETIELLLGRILHRLANPPSGGGPGDYEAWAAEVGGVTRAWQDDLALGAGTVVVYFVRDGQSVIAPTPVQVAQVQAYIDARAPVTATPTASTVSLVQLNPAISLDEDSTEARARVRAQLNELLLRIAEPGVTLDLGAITSAIQKGGGNHNLTSPAADVTHADNELPVLGSIAWS